MASQFLELLKDVDIVSDAENIKKLLKMPYSKAPVSLVLHRVNRTLLFDNFDIHGFLLRNSEKEWEWLKKFCSGSIFNPDEKKMAIVKRNTRTEAIQHRNLVSKFLYHSVEAQSLPDKDEASKSEQSKQEPNQEESVGKNQTEVSDRNLLHLPLLPDPSVDPNNKESHEFARNLIWNFEDIQMFIGSDMPIFGDDNHPAVSLRLHDKRKPINVLTGMDYWLDNLMCQVPEVLMCYHLDGIVQRYELIKTEELPNVKSGKFSPKTVCDVAKNILAFLKSNAAREGHTYWLFKGKDDDVVKLYDLTSLSSQSNADDNPFKTAVSLLMYKVAKNILQKSEGQREEEGTIKQLLDNCLLLLNEKEFPHIATSAHFMLSELYIPNNVDPACPNFSKNSGSLEGATNSKNVKDFEDRTTKAIEIGTLVMPHKKIVLDDEIFKPKALTSNPGERSLTAISHVVKGLQLLESMQQNLDEQKNKEEKEKEQQERDNIKMSTPSQAIPMSYDDPTNHQVEKVLKNQVSGLENSFLSDSEQNKPSWHGHLMAVLMEKAFLAYTTLAENNFNLQKYGLALKYVKRALNCLTMAKTINPDFDENDFLISVAFVVAGNSYLYIAKNWKELVTYQEEFNSCSDLDLELASVIENYVDEYKRDWLIKLPTDISESLLTGKKCSEHGIAIMGSKESKSHIRFIKQLGNINNEIGVFYMNQASDLIDKLSRNDVLKDTKDIVPTSIINLLEKALACYEESIENFEDVKDKDNKALLLLNCGKLCRIYAYAYATFDREIECSEKEISWYLSALDKYETALNILKSRKKSPQIWDFICREHCGTLYSLGNQLQDYPPLSRKSYEDIEKQITKYYTRALRYGDPESSPFNESEMQLKAGEIHSKLGSLYHKAIRENKYPSESKVNRMTKLSDAHYRKALEAWCSLDQVCVAINILLELTSLQLFGLEQVTIPQTKLKYLVPILEDLIRCGKLFVKYRDLVKASKEELKMYSDRCEVFLKFFQVSLLTLSQIFKVHKKNRQNFEWAKQIYSDSLKLRLDQTDFLPNCIHIVQILSEKVPLIVK